MTLPTPRNAAAVTAALATGQLKYGDTLVVSFVGDTDMAGPHVYCDSGKRYDWRFAAGLQVVAVVRPGVNAAATLGDLFRSTVLYPTVVDFDRKVVGSIVEPGRVWPIRKGSDPWQALFG